MYYLDFPTGELGLYRELVSGEITPPALCFLGLIQEALLDSRPLLRTPSTDLSDFYPTMIGRRPPLHESFFEDVEPAVESVQASPFPLKPVTPLPPTLSTTHLFLSDEGTDYSSTRPTGALPSGSHQTRAPSSPREAVSDAASVVSDVSFDPTSDVSTGPSSLDSSDEPCSPTRELAFASTAPFSTSSTPFFLSFLRQNRLSFHFSLPSLPSHRPLGAPLLLPRLEPEELAAVVMDLVSPF
ncbi:hypothetical protein JCM8547_001231 [Rhodosporidiobolus lusitaniae]